MIIAALVLFFGAAAAPYKADPGPHAVTVQDVTWKDAARGDREIPAKLYLPDAAACPCPAIVFSPGLGGSRDGYVFAGKHWASHGYVVSVITHRGSDTDAVKKAWKDDDHWSPKKRGKAALETVLADADARKARPKDVSFALDQLLALTERKVDAARAGVGGHSYGAWTTMVTMGAKAQDDFRDPRFVAGIAMSPQGSSGWAKFDTKSWAGLTSPMLYMSGTKDDFGGQTAVSRRAAYDAQTAKDQRFVMIDGAAHFAFSDNDGMFGRDRDPRHHGWILQETTAFWDAYLRGDATAKAWLDAESLESVTKNAAKIDRR